MHPKLKEKAGGYQFFKCIPNSRCLEPLPGLILQSPIMLKQKVGLARAYIWPLQKNLDTTTVKQVNKIVSLLHALAT